MLLMHPPACKCMPAAQMIWHDDDGAGHAHRCTAAPFGRQVSQAAAGLQRGIPSQRQAQASLSSCSALTGAASQRLSTAQPAAAAPSWQRIARRCGHADALSANVDVDVQPASAPRRSQHLLGGLMHHMLAHDNAYDSALCCPRRISTRAQAASTSGGGGKRISQNEFTEKAWQVGWPAQPRAAAHCTSAIITF